MKNYTLSFVLGVVMTLLCVFISKFLLSTPSKGYQYSNTEDRKKFIQILDSHEILYVYKIDEHKEHWVFPLVSDLEYLTPIENEFKNYKSRTQQ